MVVSDVRGRKEVGEPVRLGGVVVGTVMSVDARTGTARVALSI